MHWIFPLCWRGLTSPPQWDLIFLVVWQLPLNYYLSQSPQVSPTAIKIHLTFLEWTIRCLVIPNIKPSLCLSWKIQCWMVLVFWYILAGISHGSKETLMANIRAQRLFTSITLYKGRPEPFRYCSQFSPSLSTSIFSAIIRAKQTSNCSCKAQGLIVWFSWPDTAHYFKLRCGDNRAWRIT